MGIKSAIFCVSRFVWAISEPAGNEAYTCDETFQPKFLNAVCSVIALAIASVGA
jgi:hypothetical protein